MGIRNIQREFHEELHFDTEDKTYRTPEGFIVDNPICGRVGIQEYHNPDGTVRREFRPPEEVFAEEALASFKFKPVIITHDAGRIDIENVSDEEIGTITSEGYRDGDYVKAEIVIHDVKSFEDCGLRELSLGYNLELDETPGEYNGEPYDAIQRHIRINHLALVANARAGGIARLNVDSKDDTETTDEGGSSMAKNGSTPLDPEEFQKKVDDFVASEEEPEKEDSNKEGVEPETVTDSDDLTPAEKIQMVRDHMDRRDADNDPDDLESATKMIAERDKDIKTLLDAIDSLEAEKDMQAATDTEAAEESNTDAEEPETAEDCGNKDGDEAADCGTKDSEDEPQLNEDSVDRIVAEKLKVLRIGDKLNMDGLDDLSTIEAKKAIIRKVNPSINFDGKSKGYINAAYDFVVDNIVSVKKDANYQRMQMNGYAMNMDGAPASPAEVTRTAQQARDEMIARMDGNDEGGNE